MRNRTENIGKVVLEKFLYTCPDIKKIFVLVRGKVTLKQPTVPLKTIQNGY